MKVLQEITQWGDNTPNHVYHVNDSGKLVAYIPATTGVLKTFKVPKMFDTRARKFKTLSTDPAVEVKGSSGKTYIVSNGRCSCPGFTFRGKCKHIG